MSTLLLTRTDVQRSMEALSLLEEMREAFRADAARPEAALACVQTALHPGGWVRGSFPGTLPGIPAYTVKVQTGGTGSASPARGVVHLHALDTGALLAVMDAAPLRALGLGVVGALAADVLARPDASRVALIGAGPLAGAQLKSLRLVRSLQHVRVYDEDTARAVEFSARMYKAVNLPVRPAVSVEEALEDADVVITTTLGREPLLFPGMARAGTHITALGADAPGLAELSAGLWRQSSCFVDGAGLPPAEGPMPVPTALGQVLAGARPGRRDAAEVTVFGALGPPWQDLVAAWHVWQGARGDDTLRRVEWEA